MMGEEALKAAKKLGERLKKTALKSVGRYSEDVRYGATGDATYEVDEPVEREVEEFFQDLRIPCRVMTEDTGVRDFGKKPEYVFLIDPLDGSRNARRGLPMHCASIAVYGIRAKELSDAKYAVIERFDADEEYVAIKGEGATLNGKKISPSKKAVLDDAIIAMGCHFASTIPLFSDVGRRLGALTSRDERNIMVKCYGSTALELAFLACGKVDFIYDLRAGTGFSLALKTYDVAAGILLCREAGAIVEYGCRKIPEKLPVDPKVKVQIAGAGNKRFYDLLKKAAK